MEQRFDNTKRMENLSYAVKYYRNKKGYTQEALAEKLGISRQHMELVFNIATVLEIEPYFLLKFRLEL